jgi:two-component system sensor histidine kinase VanS
LKNKTFRTKFVKRAVFRCALAIIATSILYAMIIVLGYYVGHLFLSWMPSPVYYGLEWIDRYAHFVVPGGWFVLALVVIYIYWRKTARYIDDIAAASMALAHSDSGDIRLPDDLREIESRMNEIKRIALQNERDAEEAERRRNEAEQRKNDLVMNLAHDIRTPLSSVIGYLSLLDEAQDMPAEQRVKYTEITLEKAFRLERLVEEFFEITRFNLTSLVLSKGRINLSFMLQQLADEFYPMLSPQNKQAVVHAPSDLFLWGDADKLSRVFNNILKNAIAYSYDDSVIDITAFGGTKFRVIRFTNAGDPIPPQKLETIFERFFRLDTARSSQTGGAGLGLAIAKEIVTAHGGTITATSDENKTVFTVILPIEHSETLQESSLQEPPLQEPPLQESPLQEPSLQELPFQEKIILS